MEHGNLNIKCLVDLIKSGARATGITFSCGCGMDTWMFPDRTTDTTVHLCPEHKDGNPLISSALKHGPVKYVASEDATGASEADPSIVG